MTIHKYVVISVGVVAVISLGLNIFLGFKLNSVSEDPIEITAKEVKDIANRVSKLMILPQNETPTLATVSDPEKLKNQPFFANAKTGFKVLVYAQAQKAILYDPYENKIVEVAPINTNQGTTSTQIR